MRCACNVDMGPDLRSSVYSYTQGDASRDILRYTGSVQTKSREVAARRTARRRGYDASKSRLRDPLAVGFGRWTVTGPKGSRVSPLGGWTLEEVEEWLASMASTDRRR